ncbi:AbrB family transcriptional regulator [Mesobacillus subterraneus]|uniref:AbrB family transcriptional regulator n=1 Tax=Mesobacillus subterraneus TaxID=285983 RepID=UPI00203B1B9B|nr:AbrB family transcriptional regulator [Mesobacillus subterraneus]MCM3666291.1 AbrB family transcriptional regulator [Mesobacillus subterraneus]MCM3685289.1 AbrB family transcriptional regulator [Mesobacillus subterraneus]
MFLNKVVFLAASLLTGGIFTLLKIPAGWLLGALWCGILVRMFLKDLPFSSRLIKVSQVLIGIGIGLMIKVEFFSSLLQYFFPFLLSISLMIISGLLLGMIFNKLSGLDTITAFFCCIPGGATEVIAVSNDYGANEKIVAAFHSTRIILIVSIVPFLLSFFVKSNYKTEFTTSTISILSQDLIFILAGISVSVSLAFKFKMPAGALVFSILTGFIISVFTGGDIQSPRIISGIGQAWIGGIIGLRFDKETFMLIARIGWSAVLVLFLYLIIGIGIALLFYVITPLDIGSSILSIIPAGAVEMTSIALFLHLDATLVAFMQVSRLIIMFLTMPKLIHLLIKHNNLKNI